MVEGYYRTSSDRFYFIFITHHNFGNVGVYTDQII